ncbi:TetR/AcrR family transcriptional regulator [Paenibacillus sp. GCM10023248]|uniref:TetR/AcrR family transcriptional regulator n=1 Tax=unclassified Paenibacillus TaxID=185978 RepID=UPI002379BB32|nr:TetR/AcrR family transcriptional regulator [Paenibacillus sp. MAHUQ-63]MDD9266154.1 TetR/AcrR family transcriptional regulator [Paenibacillus sp. MAHUQ-63]
MNNSTKMQLLEAAKSVFARKGFEKTNLIEIIHEAGIRNKLVVYQFKGKDGLMSAVLQTFLPLNKIIWKKELHDDPVVWMKQIINDVVHLREKDPEILSILQSEIMFPSNRGDLVDFYISSIWKEFRDVLDSGKTRGCFQFGSLELTLAFVISSTFMYKQEFQTNTKIISSDIITSETTSLVLKALDYKSTDNSLTARGIL